MSSTSSQESAASPSDLNELECEPSRSVRLSRSPGASSPSIGPKSPATTTCEVLPLTASPQMALPLTLSAEDSPVRISALQERARAWPANGRDYGAITPELLARFDQDLSSWKTSQRCLVEGWTTFSETWPRSGMMRNGTVYQLPPLALPTGGIESGSWPTPDASVAQDGERPATWLARRERVKLTANNGNGMGMPLTIAVQLWPTPTARDFRSPGRSRLERTGSKAGECLPQAIGGQLNPMWVEWLMGFPAEWTALKHSETPSCLRFQKSSGEQS
jgi:hypothetical protein